MHESSVEPVWQVVIKSVGSIKGLLGKGGADLWSSVLRPFSPEFGLTSELSGEGIFHSCLGGAFSFDPPSSCSCKARA